MNNKPLTEYDQIISLGEGCFVATYLNSSGLRNFSSPFDWVMGSTLELRLELLCNDFKDFINLEDLVCITESFDKGFTSHGIFDFDKTNDVYVNKRNKIQFNHDFLRGENLEQKYPEVLEKYQRRSERLIDAINNSKHVLLLYADMPKEKSTETNIDKVIELLVKLNIHYPHTYIKLLYFKYSLTPNPHSQIINKYLEIGEYFSANHINTTKLENQPKLENIIKPNTLTLTSKENKE